MNKLRNELHTDLAKRCPDRKKSLENMEQIYAVGKD